MSIIDLFLLLTVLAIIGAFTTPVSRFRRWRQSRDHDIAK
jgi:hypothetical protein